MGLKTEVLLDCLTRDVPPLIVVGDPSPLCDEVEITSHFIKQSYKTPLIVNIVPKYLLLILVGLID